MSPTTIAFVLVCCTAGDPKLPKSEETNWGPAENGLASRLTLITKQSELGKPVRLRLELRNRGNAAKEYDSQQASVNNSFKITGPDGKAVPYVALSFQTSGGNQAIGVGAVTTIISEIDVARQYLMDSEGKYAITFVGRGGIPASNSLEVKLGPGQLSEFDKLFAAMHKACPAGWRAARYENSISLLNVPTGLKADAAGISIYFTKDNDSGSKARSVALGNSTLGYAWMQADAKAKERWPDHAKFVADQIKPFLTK